jgi:hypothetical protein
MNPPSQSVGRAALAGWLLLAVPGAIEAQAPKALIAAGADDTAGRYLLCSGSWVASSPVAKPSS